MTDLVSVASNAVQSYQRALGTVSNNIANVGTEGYSRQEVVLVANPVSKVGTLYLGTGVTVDTVKRQYDTFAEANLRNSNSDLTSQEPMVTYANRVIDIMGSSSMGLSGALDQFFNAARDLSSDPASTVMRGSFLRDSENLAARFDELSGQLDLVQSETDEALKSYVNSMNTTFKQLAAVNVQLTKQKSADLQPADLLDQRDVLLKDLSGYAHIKTGFAENGSVTVSLGQSLTRDVVVDGLNYFMLGTNFNSAAPEKVSLVLDPYGNATSLTGVTGGRLSGIMSFREQVLGSSRSSLDTLANNFVKQVNTIHSSGIDAYGNNGTDLFTINSSGVGAAGSVKVNITDALKVSAAAQFRVIEAPNNTSGTDAAIAYVGDPTNGPPNITKALANNPSSAAAITVKPTDSRPVAAVATIPNGLTNISVLMGEADKDQQLQIFTRDGRQLAGTAVDAGTQSLILTEANGFAVNASYSSSYLNVNGTESYKDIGVFYGAKASMGSVIRADITEADPTKHTTLPKEAVPATLQSDRIQTGLTSIAAGLFKINGVALPEISVPTGTLQASDIATQIQAVGIQGIKVSAKNEIRIPVSQLKLDLPLSLKSGNQSSFTEIIKVPTGLTNVQGLIDAFKSASNSSGVEAYLGDDGNLVLTNTTGKDITIDSAATPNTLGLKAGNYGGRISITRVWIEGIDLDNPNANGLSSIPAGTVKLNGTALPEMSVPTGTLQATDIAAKIQAAGISNITASAKNEIRIPVSQLKLNLPLSLKSGSGTGYTEINASSNTLPSVQGLIEAINSKSSSTAVKAYLGTDGNLVLTNTTGNEGKDIAIAGTASSNALGKAGNFVGQISTTRAWVEGVDTPIELGFANGKPSDLAKMGFKTGAYLSGTANEDLLVFVTGAGEAKVSTGYSGQPVSSKQALRTQPLQLKFDSPTHFTIIDVNTNTKVAERNFDPNFLEPALNYQGIQISFSTPPKAGDVFNIDGNKDGTGNNENMLQLVDLESEPVMGGGKTFSASYIDNVNDLGNIARQATISQSALKVVYDQAVTARDQVSGVSLDEEAADLVRYQQAYQAAAKILQVASQLFDSVLQVR